PGRMRTHPVFLRLEGRRCVIVGGDAPAVAKARGCAEAGAEVTVVAPEVGADLAGIRHVDREYRPGDLAGAVLAYASTRDPELVRQGRSQEVDALLAREAGAGCTLVRLGVALGGEG